LATDSLRTEPITDSRLRELFLAFFVERGHVVIPSASLVPENDPTVLFTTAGMHPLTPYLKGETHPSGTRLVDYQKCVRTTDIDEVGDASHLTFFEMLGNWSLGDYYKQDSITWSFEFLTSPDYLGIPLDRLWFTVFEGDEQVARDDESLALWESLGVPSDRIIPLGAEHNWWSAGAEGTCGPDTEIFMDRTGVACDQGERCLPGSCECERFVEIWNNVFMSYERRGAELLDLPKRNVDTGMGLERTVAMLNGYDTVYEVPSLVAIRQAIVGRLDIPATDASERALRVLTDHLRAATFMIGDPNSVVPSNQGRGYVVRRLIRRSIRTAQSIGIDPFHWADSAHAVIDLYETTYPELAGHRDHIVGELRAEGERFLTTLHRGMRKLTSEIETVQAAGGKTVSGEVAFHLYDTDGFPLELTLDVAREAGLGVDVEDFDSRFAEHREKSKGSRAAGGMADDSEESVRYHTATHLLHAALREVLGDHVFQKGSNITKDRMRFDFSHHSALTPEEIARVTELVQGKIDEHLAVEREVMSVDQARDAGAIGLFDDKYEGQVSVYRVPGFSLEFCGGPHVTNTGDLGHFKIVKEQSAGAGVRRIRAELESAA
jgi:alanyl-tRNA synthetase